MLPDLPPMVIAHHSKIFLLCYLYQQGDNCSSSQGAMFESVLKTSCEIIEFGWKKDRSPVETFILGLATSIRERNDYGEEVM